MTQRPLIALIVFVLASTALAETRVTSQVTDVVVYRDGALITREASIQLPAGEHLVELIDLPTSADSDIQIASDASGVRLGQIRTRIEPTSSSYDADYAAAEAAVREQALVLQQIDDDDAAANLQLSFLQSFADGYAKDARVSAERSAGNSTTWRDALALLNDGSAAARGILRENIGKRHAAQVELNRRQQLLNNLRGRARRRAVVYVAVASARPIDTRLTLSYFETEASWSPVYEARLNSQTTELELVQIAEVNQESDEDWNNVTLTLSTSEPTGELEAPFLDTERLQLQAIEPVRRARAAATLGVAADEMVEEIIVTGSRLADTDVGNYAVNYTIPGTVSIANTADDTTFDLSTFRFNANLVTTLVPLESTDAFLQARFTYTESVPLYGSRMRIYVDGTFAGWSSLQTALPGADVTIPMGRDRRVDLQVRPQAADTDRRGLINRRRFETTHSLYEITNRRATPTLVEVWDRYPIAEDRDIRVEIDKTATTPTETNVDDEPGIIKFSRQLDAGESWSIRQRYTVSYPQKRRLVRR
ncbi:MAG: DUF4139 domain-containing protein [Pseudomonadota bacterium]